MKKINHPDCFKCQYFYVTWDVSAPRGCQAFEFKTRRIPSEVVFESSGETCLKYTPKPQQKPKPPKTGWIA